MRKARTSLRLDVLKLLRRTGARLRGAARRLRVGHRGHGISEAVVLRELETIYTRTDPWSMNSPREQYRFAATNEILRRELLGSRQRFGSLLEIGCGEGHHALHLRPLCRHYTGIDLVGTAVARARARIPDGEFIVGELRDQPWIGEAERFDAVLACEVLSCFSDIPATLALMSRLGAACLVTWYDSASHLIERPLANLHGVQRTVLRYETTVWHVAWWQGAAARQRRSTAPGRP